MMYWDTSCVLKLYVEEADSEFWTDRAGERTDGLYSSALLKAELGFALAHKERRGVIQSGSASLIMRQFAADVQAGRFQLFPLGSDVLAAATALAEHMADDASLPVLRTLDGLHLATARLLKTRQIATADQRLADAATAFGLRLLTPS